jgi:hypothetical protein
LTSDPLNDPRFPNRPQHPDFWALVSAVNYLDGEALEGGRSVRDIIRQYVDEQSLAYISQQRLMRALTADPNAPSFDFRAIALSLYMDGFAVGCQFTREQEKP